MSHVLNEGQANAIYGVLVEHAGAVEEGGEGFVYLQTRSHFDEYRFIGSLGFGGKFWNCNGRWYVSAYPETVRDRPYLGKVIDDTNDALADLHNAMITR